MIDFIFLRQSNWGWEKKLYLFDFYATSAYSKLISSVSIAEHCLNCNTVDLKLTQVLARIFSLHCFMVLLFMTRLPPSVRTPFENSIAYIVIKQSEFSALSLLSFGLFQVLISPLLLILSHVIRSFSYNAVLSLKMTIAFEITTLSDEKAKYIIISVLFIYEYYFLSFCAERGTISYSNINWKKYYLW